MLPPHQTTLLIIENAPGEDHYWRQFQQESVSYQFLTEPYGVQALEVCRSHPIDSILLRLSTPYASSLNFLHQLKQQLGAGCPPIIAFGSREIQVAVQAFRNGATDYLVEEQVTLDELRLAIGSAVEHAQLRQEFQVSQAQFQTSVENMLDCFGIFSSIRDESGQIVDFRIDYLNQAACENNRMPKEMQVRHRLCEVFPGHLESGLFEEYCQVVETGEPLIKESLIYEDTYGDQQQLVRAYDIHATPLNDGFVASWRDITDRKQLELELNQTIADLQQTEVALRISQQHYQVLAEAMPQMVWVADAAGAVTYWNQRWYEYTGLSEAESFGIAGVETIHADERDRTLSQWWRCVAQGESFEIEYRIRRWDGEYRWFICRGTPTQDNQNQITGWIGTITDIDEQKQIEAALQQKVQEAETGKQTLDALMEYIPEGITIADAPEVRIRNVSRYGRELIGRSLETEGIPGEEHPDAWTIFHADGTTPATTAALPLTRAVQQGEVITNEEWIFQKADDQKIVILCNAGPIRNTDGEITGGITAWRDISDRKRMEDILRQSQEQLELAMEAAGMGSWEWNIQTNEIRWSASLERLFGMAPGSFDGQYETVMKMIHPEDLSRVQQAMHRAAYDQEDYHIEFRFFKPDGTIRWALGRGRVFYSATGQPLKMTGIDLDITVRKQAEGLLRDNEERFRTLADNISQFAWMADATGGIFWYNQRWFDYTGTTLDDMQGWGWQQVHHPDHVERVVQEFRRCIEAGETWEDTFPLRGNDGQYRWFLSRAIPLRNEQGRVVRWFGTNTDITELRQTELTLQTTTERLNVALKGAPLTLFNQDRDLRYTWIYNPTYHMSVEEVLGRRDEDLVDAETADRLTSLKQQVLNTGATLREVVKVINDGQTNYYDLTIDPIRDAQNAIVGITCAAVDMSERARLEVEREQAQAALAVNEARLRGFVESNIVGILYGDIYGGIAVANDEFLRMVGYTHEDLQAGRLRWIDMTPPEYLPLDEQAIAEARIRGACTPYEKEYICKDGSRVPVLIGYSLVGEAREESVAFILDLSDRKQAEIALRQSEDRLRLAIESAQLGIWDWNLLTNQLTWDAGCKAMFGLPPDAESSIDVFFAGLHPDDRDRLDGVVQQALNQANGGNYDTEYRTIGIQDGVERWIKAKGQAYFDCDGKPLRFTGTVLDITPQKQAEAEREQLLKREQAAREDAERANRIKDEFLAILSHELRSPLNPILGWAKLLQTGRFDAAKTAAALATIERNAKVQTQLIDDLLDVAKILRGKLTLEMAPTDLACVIEAAIDTVRSSAAAKQIYLHCVIPAMGQVSGDAARLQQIIWNLLSNAIKFTPDFGRVDVQLERSGDRVQITVSDTGKGIKAEFLPYIFESFRQEDASTTRKFGGLGLGLAIVRQLVEAHGGTISAASPGEGLGTTFTVRLPLLKTEPVLQQTEVLLDQEPDLTGMRILVVDDDPDARELLAAILIQCNAEVMTVSSAVDVLNNLASFQPDLLISDIGMPEVDGYALIQRIRALSPEHGGQLPAIALTAYAREEDHQRAMTNGYQCHVTKPLDPAQLVQSVMMLMHGLTSSPWLEASPFR